MKASIFGAVVLAAVAAAPAIADDAHFRPVEYRENVQTTVVCPSGLLCALRLQRGEHIRDGLNSQVAAWDPHAIYEGDAEPTPLLTFKPQAEGLRANVIVTTDRRTYIVMLKSTSAGDAPTYLRFTFGEDSRTRAQRAARSAPPKPPSIAEQLNAACVWMAQNAEGESYTIDAGTERWRPVRVCHDARVTWIALAPSATVANDLPVLLELTPSGERVTNYTMFAPDRIIRDDGIGDGYVLRSGRSVLRVHRIARALAAAVPAPALTTEREHSGP